MSRCVWINARYCCLAAAGLFLAGCGDAPPPPPPAPPPVESPPAQADAATVARHLAPFYFVLFDRGFNADLVETPSRSRIKWPASRSELQPIASGLEFTNPEMARRLRDAEKATPPLATVSAAYGITDATWTQAVAGWAGLVAPRQSFSGERSAIPPELARETMLAITFRQAIHDADRKNYHRAHVLLTDMAHAMGEDSPLRQRDGRDVFIRFFRDVPDTARFEDFAGRLTAYSEAREKEVLLAGEHAAVLNAAGLNAAAGFMRDQLLSQFDLITLPMIDKAIQRGESFGFQTPERVSRLRGRLESLAESLRQGDARGGDPYRTAAVAAEADDTYRTRLAAFEEAWTDGGPAAAEDDSSVEQQLDELTAAQRNVVDWLREKTLVTRHVPLLTLRQPMTYRFLEMISPVAYDPAEKALALRPTTSLPAEEAGLGDAIGAWCRGEPLPDALADGSAHALLAWYWLECRRPEFARAALIGGGRALLERAKRVPRDQVVKLQDAAAATLLDELNGYRFLIAAAEIEAAPAGAIRGAGARYLPELAVLLANWQQTWEDCALPPLAADLVVRGIEERVAQREAMTGGPGDSRERYSFGDYRFTHGVVPDVVVERAIERNTFGPSGDSPPAATDLREFFLDFRWPNAFSSGSLERWKVKEPKT